MGTRRGGKGAARPARTTGRPPKKAKNGVRQAAKLLARLDTQAFRERARLTEAEMRMLDRLSSGAAVPRHAPTILHAIEFRAEYAYARPRQEVEHSGNVIFEIHKDGGK